MFTGFHEADDRTRTRGGGESSDRLIPRNKTMITKSIMSGTFVFRMKSKCRLGIVCHQIFIPVSFDFGI